MNTELPLGLTIEVSDFDDHRVVSLSGEMDLSMAGAQSPQFSSAVCDGPGDLVVLDMSGVDFCDSYGLGQLVFASKRVWQRGGEVRLAGAHEQIIHLLKINALEGRFRSFGTLAEARAHKEDAQG